MNRKLFVKAFYRDLAGGASQDKRQIKFRLGVADENYDGIPPDNAVRTYE